MENYDLIIIGAGGSGLAGAMYAARLGLKTLVLGHATGSERPIGGTITTTDVVRNYPGFSKIDGFLLAKKLEEHAREYELVTILQEKVTEIKKIKKNFAVKTEKAEYYSKTILFATGAKWKKIKVPGTEKFERKGISYCALCDAPLYKNKVVAVVGGANSAACEALILAKFAKKVYMIYRGDKVKIENARLREIEKSKKIEIIKNTNLKEIKGDSRVTGIVLDKPYKNSEELKLDGIFIAAGQTPISELAKSLGVKLNSEGEIVINHKTSETNVPGIFAAGDVTDKQFKQLITGVADACTAAYSAYEYLREDL